MSVEIQVLVVEDEALLRMDIAYHLTGQGFQVFEADLPLRISSRTD
jgi:DNA-binding response OmpR family regulator